MNNQKQILSGGYPNHGLCVLSNNATIQNAEVGIKNHATINGDGVTIDYMTLGGGIVQSTNGKFVNCVEGVQFIKYINKNGLNNPITEKSFFTTTQFLTNAATAVVNFQPKTHLSMSNTKGIGITSVKSMILCLN